MLGCPANKCIVTLKSSNGRYVQASTEQYKGLVFPSSKIVKDAIKWYISFLGCNTINLKNKKSGNYLTAKPDGEINHLRPHFAGQWEQFKLELIEDKKYALKTYHGKYISALPKPKGLVGNSESIDEYEIFRIDVCKYHTFVVLPHTHFQHIIQR